MTTTYKEALQEILKCGRLDIVKEIAADALDVDLIDFLEEQDVVLENEDYMDNVEVDDLLHNFE